MKDFDYHFNPLKRDSILLKEYHLVESSNFKTLGPPIDGFKLSQSKSLNKSGCSTVATTSTTTISNKSILESMLDPDADDYICMPPEHNSSRHFYSAGLMQFILQNPNNFMPAENLNKAKSSRSRIRRKMEAFKKNMSLSSNKKIDWPKIENLDSMAKILNNKVIFLFCY